MPDRGRAPQHHLARVALKGREFDPANRPASNLVFLVDVSGSMQGGDKLPLLVRSMLDLTDKLDRRDRVGIVDHGRPVVSAFGLGNLDDAGMDVDWPYFDGDLLALVGEQTAEKTPITSVRVDITSKVGG